MTADIHVYKPTLFSATLNRDKKTKQAIRRAQIERQINSDLTIL